jgi:hypothetical protein
MKGAEVPMRRHRNGYGAERGCERIANALIERIAGLVETWIVTEARSEVVRVHIEAPRRLLRPGEAREAARLASQTLSRSCVYEHAANGVIIYRVYLSA